MNTCTNHKTNYYVPSVDLVAKYSLRMNKKMRQFLIKQLSKNLMRTGPASNRFQNEAVSPFKMGRFHKWSRWATCKRKA